MPLYKPPSFLSWPVLANTQHTMTSHLDFSGCKKRKRGERVFRFKSFGENGYPVGFVGSTFRENVKALLEYGHVEGGSLCSTSSTGMKCWSFQLQVHRHAPAHVMLFVVEEPIEASLNRHCKQCQYVGWGQHMVCNKKYHFVLPSADTMVAAAACLNCKGGKVSSSVGNGGILVDTAAINGNAGNSSNSLVELEGHMMHGVFHSNGFGHLLCVNGLETGSDLAGHQILEFWDRLCTGLRARKVSLNDDSQKRGMELRLIHGVAYSEPWFGRWGYKFGRASFCVTQQMYQKAIEALQGMPLCLLIHDHLATSNHDIPLIFSRYHTLSDNSLVTLGDLFHFMLELKSRLPPTDQNSCIDSSYNPAMLVETNCRWSPKRVQMATRVIVEALKRAQFRWVSRQEVRDAARAYIGDTGLLDFVLKSLGNHIVGNYLVRRTLNPVTKVLEYCLEDISNHVSPNNQDSLLRNNPKMQAAWYKISKFQLMKDMFYLYKHILKDQKLSSTGIFSAIPMAVRIIIDSKYLVKDYCGGEVPMEVELGLQGKSNIYCTVMLTHTDHEELDHDQNYNKIISNNATLPPYECLTLKNNATVDELKKEVERNFREIYWGLRGFVVETIGNLKNAKGTDMVFGLVEAGQKIVVEGSNKDMRGLVKQEMYECGRREHVVDCPCGAKEDDGERMVGCDICEVRQHTLCVRIPNNEQVPHIFLCNRCEREIILLPSP